MFDEITNNGYVSEHICWHLMAIIINDGYYFKRAKIIQ
jgi:hypothetical protein